MRASLPTILPTILLAALALAGAAAHAQVYKCTVDGQVTYAQAPCERGTQQTLDTPPPVGGAAGQQAAAQDLKRLQRESARLQKGRQDRAARQDIEDARSDHAAGVRREKCGKLRLAAKWADEDARRAPPQAAEAARLKARRAAERQKAECPA